MNGASADDCAKMSRTPSRSRTTIIGRSQSFLFCRRNIHTSPASESLPITTKISSDRRKIFSSEQTLELLACLPCSLALYPVALARLAATPQGVAPGEPHYKGVGREHDVVHQRQQHAAVDVAERGSEAHPRIMEDARRRAYEQTGDEQKRADAGEDDDDRYPP